MLMGVHDNHVFVTFEQQGRDGPIPCKKLSDRTIYLSQPMPLTKGIPCLSDLSEARMGKSEHTGDIMPDVYRAPEVILDMPWSYPVDIWSLGMVVSLNRIRPQDLHQSYGSLLYFLCLTEL